MASKKPRLQFTEDSGSAADSRMRKPAQPKLLTDEQKAKARKYHLSEEIRTETRVTTRTVQVDDYIGQVVTSAYCSCPICCGIWSGGPTASGVYPRANHTIAVDANNPRLPMGTEIIMNGTLYKVEDTGNFARYGVDFDVYYDSHQAALNHGHQTWDAWVAKGKKIWSHGNSLVLMGANEDLSQGA